MIRQINVVTGVETQRAETQAEQDASVIAVAEELANAPVREIQRLESQITIRRIREAYSDSTWMDAQEALIVIERSKL